MSTLKKKKNVNSDDPDVGIIRQELPNSYYNFAKWGKGTYSNK